MTTPPTDGVYLSPEGEPACGCVFNLKVDWGTKVHPPAPDCPFCDGTGWRKRLVPGAINAGAVD